MYRGAMACILSELVRQDRLVVVETFDVDAPKTKAVLAALDALGVGNALIVSDQVSENLYLGARNLPKVEVTDVNGTNPVSLVAHEKVVITVAALKKFEEMFK
jgi:large subunit ribosomal protein L4